MGLHKGFLFLILIGAILNFACRGERGDPLQDKSGSGEQDSVYYSGKTLSNVDYHHGQLRLAKGVHNIQVMRASREDPASADGFGWTYNHAPNLAWWNNSFFLQSCFVN